MKRLEKNIRFACLAALAIGFVACSQDELSPLTGGTEGTPVTFTAAGLTMPQAETRATVDGTWKDALSVAIKIGSEVKEYAVTPNADNPKTATLAAAEGVMPFYWRHSTETKVVEAWYPYKDGETSMPDVVVQQDQSIEANYWASDLLSATNKTVSYDNTALEFNHRTAKITLKFTAESSNVNLENAQVLLYNLSAANGNPVNIHCYSASTDGSIHHALVAPQTFAANKEFLKLILADGEVHNYVPTASIEFKAGYQYVFNITVSSTDIKVTVGEAIPWNEVATSSSDYVIVPEDGGYYIKVDANGRRTYYVSTEAGLKAWSEYTNQGFWNTNLTLLNDITMTRIEGTSTPNFIPIGRTASQTTDMYTGTIEGNGHTIDNMVVNYSGDYYAAMVITLGGTIQNLNIGSGSGFHAQYWAASVTANNNGGKVINCHSAASVSIVIKAVADWCDGSVGGVVANNRGDDGDSYVIGCTFSGSVYAEAGQLNENVFVGGVVASSWTTGNGNEVHVVGCSSTGRVLLDNAGVSTITRVGGIVGSSYKNGSDVTNVTACAMSGQVAFSSNVDKREPGDTAFDAGIGHIYNRSTATHVYWEQDCIEAYYQNPYRSSGGSYTTLQEVDGTDVDWATATANMNSAIKTWNASNSNFCPYHFEQTDGESQPPTLVEGMP